MVGFAGRARTVCGRVEQVPKKLIREKRPRSENDLGGSECKCGGRPCLFASPVPRLETASSSRP